MTKISFNLYYQQDVTRAIATLEAIKPTLDAEPPQLSAAEYYPFSQTANGFAINNNVFPTHVQGGATEAKKTDLYGQEHIAKLYAEGAPLTGLNDPPPMGVTVRPVHQVATEARTAEATLLEEAKARGRGRPKKNAAPTATETVSTPTVASMDDSTSLLMGGSTVKESVLTPDLEAALAINFDQLLLEEQTAAEEAEPLPVEETIIAPPEPEVAPPAPAVAMTPDELKNAVIAKTKVAGLGMEWLKHLLKIYKAGKLSDLTPAQMQEALDGIAAYIAEREAVDLLG